jgi:hypothetical protein
VGLIHRPEMHLDHGEHQAWSWAGRARRPKKDVEAALVKLEEAGWTVKSTSSGHRWGWLDVSKQADRDVRSRSGRHPGALAILSDSFVEFSSGARMGGKWRDAMTIFNFTPIVDGPDWQDDNAIEALFEAGCDDALVGRVDGVQYLGFGRESDSLEDAFDVGRSRHRTS